MKKIFIFILAALFLMSVPVFLPTEADATSALWDGSIATGFDSGSGTQDDPFIIRTPAQLAYFAQCVNEGTNKFFGKYIRLDADLQMNDETFTYLPDCGLVKVTDGTHTAYLGTGQYGDKSGSNTVFDATCSVPGKWYASLSGDEGAYAGELLTWTPIGHIDTNLSFLGHFDGNGHSINGLFIGSGNSNSGLFGYLTRAAVTNITVSGSYFFGTATSGCIVGSAKDAWISNCHSDSIICGYNGAGGIVGDANQQVTIEQCSNSGTVSSEYYAGGIAGFLSGKIYNSYNTGNITGQQEVGGIAARSYGIIAHCYNTGTISSRFYTGAIVGNCYYPSFVLDCYYPAGCAVDSAGTVQNGFGAQKAGSTTADPADSCIRLSASEMQSAAAFPGFNFSHIWTFEPRSGSNTPVLMGQLDPSWGENSALWDGSIADGFASGSGTYGDPFVIRTPAQLAYLGRAVTEGNTFAGQYIVLGNDIVINNTSAKHWTLTAQPWTPIGSDPLCSRDYEFAGNFNGMGYTIRGLYINQVNDSCQALFSSIGSKGVVKNLSIKDSYIHSSFVNMVSIMSNYGNGAYYTGSIAGTNTGTIINCHSDALIFGTDYVGGIVGNSNGTIQFCSNTGEIAGNGTVGGIAGSQSQWVLNDCYNTGMVVGRSIKVGGIVGAGYGSGKSVNGSYVAGNNVVLNCYNIGKVRGDYSVGAIMGYDSYATASQCYYLTGCAVNKNGTVQYGIGIGDSLASKADVNNQLRALTATYLQQSGNFKNFDFDKFWKIDASTGYPYPQLTVQINGLPKPSVMWDGSIAEGFASGSGTKDDPYVIETAAQLAYLAQTCKDGATYSGRYFVLANNICLNDTSDPFWFLNAIEWYPIGKNGDFRGTFNGGGHYISGIYQKNQFESGVFSSLYRATVENLGVIDSVYFNYHYRNIGGIAGESSYSTIRNCYSDLDIYAEGNAGGIVGYSNQDTIVDCYNIGNIATNRIVDKTCAGGIVGLGTKTSITTCYNAGQIRSLNSGIGGILGLNNGSCTLKNCYYLTGCAKDYAGKTYVGNGSLTADNSGQTKALSTSYMKQQSRYTGFDFSSVWMIHPNVNNGMPIQTAQLKGALQLTPPNKLHYFAGEGFDPTGLALNTIFSNGYAVPVTDFTCSMAAGTQLSAGEHTVTVTWNEFTFHFTVTAQIRDMESVTVTDLNTPARGEMPDTAATATEPIYAKIDSIRWSTDSAFAYGKSYTVTIVLSPTEYSRFSENTSVSFCGITAKSTYDSESNTITATYTFRTIIRYSIYVRDVETGNPIAGAKVTLGSQNITTGSDGIATFELANDGSSYLKVTAAGYPDHVVQNYRISTLPGDYVQLYKSDSGIHSVTCNGQDVINGHVMINRFAYTQTATFDVSARSTANIIRYELLQDGVLLESSTTGTFTLHNRRFGEKSSFTIRVYTDGISNNVYEQNIHIWIVGFTLESALDLSDLLPGAGGASFTLPGDVNMIGGLELKFPINDKNTLTPKVELYNDKAVITVGWNRNLYKTPGDKTSFKDLYNEMVTEMASRKKGFGLDHSLDGSIAAVIVVEVNNQGQVSAVYGEVVFSVSYNMEMGSTVSLIGIPIRLDLEIALNGELRVQPLGYNFDEAKLIWPGLSMGFEGSLTAYAGLGFSFASVGVYGGAGLGLDADLIPFTLNEFSLHGEVGLYAKIKLFWREKVAKLTLFSGTKTWPQTSASLYNLRSYGMAGRTYLPLRLKWVNFDADQNDEVILQQNAYDRIEPTIVTCGDTRMMLFLDDDGTAGSNYQQLYFSLYDASTGTWSVPKLVSSDASPDIEFDATSDGNNIYITYTQSDMITDPDAEDLTGIVSSFEIWAARFDATTGQFTDHTNLSDNEIYDFLPQIAADKDGICVVWASNHTGDYFAQNANNVISISRLRSGSWSEATALTGYSATIVDMDMGILNGQLSIAAVRDMDSSLLTDGDWVVHLIDTNGTCLTLQTQTNENRGVTFARLNGVDQLLWYNNGNLYAIDRADANPAYLFTAPVGGLTDHFRLVNMGNEDVLLFAKGNNGSDIYGMVCRNGIWGQPVLFKDTEDGRYIETFDAMVCGGQLVIPYLSTAVTFTENDFSTSSDLRCALAAMPQDLRLNQATADPRTLYSGQDISISAVIANNSWCSTSSVIVSLQTGNGTVVWQDTVPCTIPSGSTVSITVKIPQNLLDKNTQYYLHIESGDYTETDLSTNTLPVTLWQADMEVLARYVRLGSGDILQYSVTNLGGINGSGTLYVYKLVDGQKVELYSQVVTDLAPGEYITGDLAITDNFYTQGKTGCVYVEFVTDIADASVADNSMLVTIDAIAFSGTTQPGSTAAIPAPTTKDGYLIYNRTAGGDLTITITENGFAFSGIRGMDSSAYTYQNGVLTIYGSYLQNLLGNECFVDMSFQNGEYTMQVLTVISLEGMLLQDTPLEVAPNLQIMYDGKPIESGVDFRIFTLSNGLRSFAYTADGNIWIEGLPTDAGSYTIRLSISQDEENGFLPLETTFQVVIHKANRAISVPAFIGSNGLRVIFGNAAPTLGANDGIILYGSSSVNDPMTVTNWSAEGWLDAADMPGTVYLFAMITEGDHHEAAYSIGTAVDAHIHSYSQTVVDPSCEDGGHTLNTCRCGDSFTSDPTDALGHDEQHHNAKQPTCTDYGWNAYVTCSRCDYSTYQKVDALGHNEQHHDAKQPTCTEYGWNAYVTCSRCDYSTYQEVDALGHNEQHHDAKQPTCTEYGWNAYVTCSRCDYSTYQKVDALGHNEQYHNAKQPTCTDYGWNAYVTCSRCDYSTYQKVDALGHNEQYHNAKQPTCTDYGWNAYVTCSRCDYSTYQKVDALGHNEQHHDAKQPTCTEYGWNAYVTCSRCDYSTYQKVDALGHNEQYHSAKQPTCTDYGWNAYVTCSRCDYSTYQKVDALGHNEQYHNAKQPTCTEYGWNAYVTCSRCDYSTYQKVDALGHNEQYHNAKQPTCTEYGWNAYVTCSRCDYTTYEPLDILPHDNSLQQDYLQHWLECADCHLKQDITPHDYTDGIHCGTCGYESLLIDIYIDTNPGKLVYLTDEPLDLSGMVVLAEYANGSVLLVDAFDVAGYDPTAVGVQTITVSYKNATAHFQVEVRSRIPDRITSPIYRVEDHVIRCIAFGTEVDTFLDGINEREHVTITKDDQPVTSGSLVGTGALIQIKDGDTVKDYATLIVTGDINGDGKVSVTDYIQMKSHLLGKTTLTGAPALAADINGDGKISVTDYIQMKSHLLGKTTIEPN